ncbi:MAG TPA: ATP-binding protein [Microbacterium sp.]|nr:ATP-binding protein [Microbacterium sp.]
MRAWSRPEARRTLLLLMPSLIVLACVLVTTVVAASVQIGSIREGSVARVRDVATSLATLDTVRDAIETADSGDADEREAALAGLQSLATTVEHAAGVAYVVVADADAIRLTHPTPSERGEPVRTDTSPLTTGETYIGSDTGPVGPTLRIKVPVFDDDGAVIGMVAVGILEAHLSDRFVDALRDLLPWSVGALVVGTVASALISVSLLRRFRAADDEARELEATRRTALALREQAHEFDTRIHVIRGLLAHGDGDDALRYVDEIAPERAASDDDPGAPPLLRATLEALRAELAELGAVLDADVAVPGEIDGDVTLVLANLCRNAAEAGAHRVRLRLAEEGGRIRGAVDDDGPGIDARDLPRIFANGFSMKTDADHVVRGVGLSLVRRTVASRGGMLEVGRGDLGGARFSFDMEAAS